MDERPKELVDYRSMVIEKNKLEAKITKLKPAVRSLLEESGGYDDLYLLRVEKPQYHEDVVYDWVSKEYPHLIDQISKITVDIDKFGELIKRGTIPANDIPDHCMTIDVQWHVKTTPKAKEAIDEDNSAGR